jgi:hypothetical protein
MKVCDNYTFAYNPNGLTTTLKVLLWLALGLSVANFFGSANNFFALWGICPDIELELNPELNPELNFFEILKLLISLGVLVVPMLWVLQASANCHNFNKAAQGAKPMKYSPVWAIGCHFIPIVNLFAPYRVMKEIWSVSNDPRNPEPEKGCDLIEAWWITVVIGLATETISIVFTIVFTFYSINTTGVLRFFSALEMFSLVVAIVETILTVKLIHAIVARQQHLITQNRFRPNIEPKYAANIGKNTYLVAMRTFGLAFALIALLFSISTLLKGGSSKEFGKIILVALLGLRVLLDCSSKSKK